MSEVVQTTAWRMGEKSKRRGASSAWVLSALVVLTLAGTGSVLYFFDPNGYSFYPICLFHRSTGLLCPGCGSLRALHQLLHGDVWAAFHYNPMLVTGLACLGGFGCYAWVARMRHQPVRFGVAGKWAWLILGIGLAFSVWRNFPGSAFYIPSP